MIAERDEDFQPFDLAKQVPDHDDSNEALWALADFKRLLGYEESEPFDRPVNNAKIAASRAGLKIKDHFRDGSLFDEPGAVYLTKYAAILVAINADPQKDRVALAHAYFALQVDRQCLEDEKRLKTRLDVVTENNKLNSVAQGVGVQDLKKFTGVGVRALYGGLSVAQIGRAKGLGKNQHYLDFAGSEELAATLFRITQTAAALRRQEVESERLACNTHKKVASGVRSAILAAGNTPPEQLPAARVKIDSLALQKRKQLRSDG